ncbi:MAG: MFS transporter [Pegethrix bostrychoides GSE-TBD4-15B]|jgi:ATP/ADP translocase/HEAT repeat protein|uniref:MFS transporter n=1 Tax=Pegethrix bostrychoides GSE-TBD4-15B TaxID=2839662 RepID=A0A951U3D7_9CYAN|nr:MFS transporter [Pegethrix bostrychoides GSE-TBD4-15B]
MTPSFTLSSSQRSGGQTWLRWLNLRPEEVERTFLMFAFYTLTSVGILWLEVSVAALFLGEYGAESLPWIYLASAVIGTGFGFLYSWLQRFLSLRRVIVLTAVLMALPLFLFRLDLNLALLGGYSIFLMRLWLEAIYVLNEVNTSITANQLFTIREIKRTYPLISSGILAADVVSGLSLPPLRNWLGLHNMILLAGLMLCGGAAVLFYLTRAYSQSFPERQLTDRAETSFTQQSQGQLRRYVLLVMAFFVLLQVLLLLIDFQYLSQLEQNVEVDQIADFLALFGAGLGMVELATQWLISGRVIERFGIFRVAQFSPIVILGLSCLALTPLLPLFVTAVLLKFIDELLRYTLVASTSPVLFQPLPEAQRDRIQADVRGIAEPFSTGVTGLVLLLLIWIFQHLPFSKTAPEVAQLWQNLCFLGVTALLAWGWLRTVQRLRSKYLEMLVLSADWGQLKLSQVDAQGLRRELEDAMNRPEQAFDRDGYINLLIRTDPKTASQILAPRLPQLSPELQTQVLTVMLDYPNPAYAEWVRQLIQSAPPLVLAVALRYLWLSERLNLKPLRAYCRPSINPAVRGTAAALIMRQGTARDQVEAMDVLRRMLTHKQEQERIMGCRALGDTGYLQSLRLYMKPLLKDPSLAVRCAVLEAIGTTQAEDYYGSLLKGLYYKSTRPAARRALMRLGNDALPMLQKLAEDVYQPLLVRRYVWQTIGEIGSSEAIDRLINQLLTSWGSNREMLLRVLLKLPQERGIDAVADQLGRSGIETLMAQELQFLSHLYAARLDLQNDFQGETTQGSRLSNQLLQQALRNLEADAVTRLFLLMQFLYDPNQVRAAAFSLESESGEDRARGLEILDNLLDIPKKRALLNMLDATHDAERLQYLAEFAPYRPLSPQQRLRYLVDLRHFLSDWALACCFHLARENRWNLNPSQTFACLKSPTGFVREAVLAYLRLAAPQALKQTLPLLQQDSDPLVRAQVCQLMAELGLNPASEPPRLLPPSAGSSSPDPGDSSGSANLKQA